MNTLQLSRICNRLDESVSLLVWFVDLRIYGESFEEGTPELE
jgi:hypothetical protein